MSGLVEAFVTKHLPEVDSEFLTGLCDEYRIVVADEKAGKKPELLKLVMRYLSSEDLENSADKGAGVFLKLYGELGEKLSAVKPKVEIPALDGDDSQHVRSGTTTTYHKLRHFKVHGKIGSGERVEGDKDESLTYTNLSFQIKQGEALGYSDSEIYAAIVSAIKPGNPLRDLLEIKGEQSKPNLLKILRSHFSEKDSGSVLQDLRQCVQKPKEQAKYFFMRAIALREKVALLSGQEGMPIEPACLTAAFFKSLATGLKQNNIRMEMWQTLKECMASDEDLLEEVALATANEQERVEKSSLGKSTVTVNKVTTADSDSSSSSSSTEPSPVVSRKTKNKNRNVPQKPNKAFFDNQNKRFEQMTAQINKLTTSTNTAINELKKQVSSGQAPAASTPASTLNAQAGSFPPGRQVVFNPPRRIFRCNKCHEERSYWCNHCFLCGSEEHKKPDCPQKNT